VRFLAKVAIALQRCLIGGPVHRYLPLGNLYAHLFDNNHTPKIRLHFHSIVKIALDIASGMEYLHNQEIIHRDLQTSNILVRRR
jgi:serine/threonine protein kinase